MEKIHNLQLIKFRKEIDKIDLELIKILTKRFGITDKVRLFKAKNNLPIEDRNRESEIMQRMEEFAQKYKLNPQLPKAILKLIIREVKRNRIGNKA